jgi:transcriptional regulator with XRE-family HTH domain
MNGHNKSEKDPISLHIGSRIRIKRKLLGWSQTTLAEMVGLTFQQIQKYESGANKVASPTLYRLSRVLEVPVGFFYEGLDQDITATLANQMAETREGTEMMRTFLAIDSDTSRKNLLSIARALAGHN